MLKFWGWGGPILILHDTVSPAVCEVSTILGLAFDLAISIASRFAAPVRGDQETEPDSRYY